MSWDFGFDQEDSFLQTDFDSADSMFMGGGSPFEESFPLTIDEPINIEEKIEATTITQIPKHNTSNTPDLAEENDQLRQFFTSLKEKAEQVEQINQNLKGQLEECRNWFKTAIFTGITNQK